VAYGIIALYGEALLHEYSRDRYEGIGIEIMADSERLDMDMTDSDAAEANLDGAALGEGQAASREESNSKRVIYATVAAGAVVLVFALVVIFYAIQQFDNTEEAQAPAGESTSAVGSAINDPSGEPTGIGPIVVVEETPYIHYNANTDGSVQVAGTQAQPVPQPTVEVRPATTATGGNQGGSLNYNTLKGIDVLEAQDIARRAGYVVHQVFVCCPDAVRNGTRPPVPGLVLDVQTYTMRTDGQRYLFLHVATTEPYSNARAVPDVSGLQWRNARERLAGVGIGSRFEYERSSPGTNGTVLFQAPQPGRFTPAGSTVIMILAD